MTDSFVRMFVELEEEQHQVLNEMKDLCELENNEALFNAAMGFFYFCVKESKRGKRIGSYDPIDSSVNLIEHPVLNLLREPSNRGGLSYTI